MSYSVTYIPQAVIFIVFQWIRSDYDILRHTKNKAILAFDPEEQKTCINLCAKTEELTKWGWGGGGGEKERGKEAVRSLK